MRGKLNRSLSYALVLEASALDGGGGIFVCVETRALALTLLSALALELVVRCASFHCRAADEPTLLESFVGAAGSINSWSILAWPLDELRCPVSGLRSPRNFDLEQIIFVDFDPRIRMESRGSIGIGVR